MPGISEEAVGNKNMTVLGSAPGGKSVGLDTVLSDYADNKVSETLSEPVIEEPKAEEPKAEEPVIEEPKAEEPVIEEPKAEEPVIEEEPEKKTRKKKNS